MGGTSCKGCCSHDSKEEVADIVEVKSPDAEVLEFTIKDLPTASSPSRSIEKHASASDTQAKFADGNNHSDEGGPTQTHDGGRATSKEATVKEEQSAKSLALDLPLHPQRAVRTDAVPADPAKIAELVKTLRIHEAAEELQKDAETGDPGCSTKAMAEVGLGDGFREAMDLYMQELKSGLERLATHPGLNAGLDDPDRKPVPESLASVRYPVTPGSTQSQSTASADLHCCAVTDDSGRKKRDLLEVAFDLDDEGRRVEGVVEFFPDGSAAIQWTALDIPVAMPYVLCLVHEIDLVGEIAPFIKSCGVLHQFPWNEADRLVRVVSEPPIPFVSGIEAVAQRYGFDLLDTPWEAFLLVETGAEWETPSGSALKEATGQWRGVPKPPPFRKGLKEVETKAVVALGRPVGPDGQNTTVLFSGAGDVKIPRSMLPNWLITWLVKQIGKYVYKQALDRIKEFETSEHGRRLRGSEFYSKLNERIAAHAASKKQANAGKAPAAKL